MIAENTAYMIAHIAHEANRAYCSEMGDPVQLPWDECPDWQRDSCIAGVVYLANNPKATDQSLHANWAKDKLEAGWMYGSVKDEVAKTHPCLIDYCDLPETQKHKDVLFHAIVRSFGSFS